MADWINFRKTPCEIIQDNIMIISNPNSYDVLIKDTDEKKIVKMYEDVMKSKLRETILSKITNNDNYPVLNKSIDDLRNERFTCIILRNFIQAQKLRKLNLATVFNTCAFAENGKHNIIIDMPVDVFYNFKFDKENCEFVTKYMYNTDTCFILEDF